MKDDPIINSILDLDFYKISMGNFVYFLHPDVDVEYKLIDRSKSIPENISIEEIREEINNVLTLRLTEKERKFLYKIGIFGNNYLDFLSNLKLPEVEIVAQNGRLKDIIVRGKWKEAIYWETIIMSIICELSFRKMSKNINKYSEGERRLHEKLELLKKMPSIRYADFGTRRRASYEWHDKVLDIITDNSPLLGERQFVGTSNVSLAMKYGVKPIGTMAHELFMAYSTNEVSGDTSCKRFTEKVLKSWLSIYGVDSSIALTDTYGSELFFRNISEHIATIWKGFRHDSGDPYKYGIRLIKFYKDMGIDHSKKTLVFSDGLNVNSILDLHYHFNQFFNLSFGWGTDLTHDLGEDVKPLNIVVKLNKVNDKYVVKLSDEPGKHTGNQSEIQIISKEVFKAIY